MVIFAARFFAFLDDIQSHLPVRDHAILENLRSGDMDRIKIKGERIPKTVDGPQMISPHVFANIFKTSSIDIFGQRAKIGTRVDNRNIKKSSHSF